MRAVRELRELFRQRWLQLTALGAWFAFILWRSLALKLTVRDLDNWWHLQVGSWILAHHSFPHTGIFSATAAGRPWAAYSWGYEVLLSLAYKWFDLMGMATFGTILTLLVAASVYRMTRTLSGRFWAALLIAAVACSVFLFTMCPRPAYFTMMLFTAELTLLLEANRTGRMQSLYWLPLLFLLWANLHIQFIYGLAVLGVLLAVTVFYKLARVIGWSLLWVPPGRLPLMPLVLMSAGCFLIPFISPYSYHLYEIVYGYARAKVPYQMILEMQPVTFQVPSHYLQVLLTAAAFFAVARRKPIDPFKTTMLALATFVGFRMMRDSWFLCIVAAACLSDIPAEEEAREPGESWYEWSGLAAFLLAAGLLFAGDTHFNRAGLDARISSIFPVNAANYLRKNPQPGSLYNSIDWGGFLIWYMPDHPVSIDGRTDLYGDEILARFFATGGGNDYVNDPYLNEAGIVLLERRMPLATMLQGDGRFQKVYEDQLAIVFVRQAGAFPTPGWGTPPAP
jgi:hypothetical protein